MSEQHDTGDEVVPEEVAPDEPSPDLDPDPDLDVDPDVDPESHEGAGRDLDSDDEPSESTAATGHPAVDEVLRSLDALDGRPVDEHVAAFEDAHEQLRRALSGAGDDDTP
jgi:hypothetical protein